MPENVRFLEPAPDVTQLPKWLKKNINLLSHKSKYHFDNYRKLLKHDYFLHLFLIFCAPDKALVIFPFSTNLTRQLFHIEPRPDCTILTYSEFYRPSIFSHKLTWQSVPPSHLCIIGNALLQNYKMSKLVVKQQYAKWQNNIDCKCLTWGKSTDSITDDRKRIR